MSNDPPKLRQSKRKKKVVWQATTLSFLESIRALVFILSLVLMSALYSTLAVVLDWTASTPLSTIDFMISLIFMLELSLRMYCYRVVNKSLYPFFTVPLNVVDVSVVLFDVILLSLNSSLGGAALLASSIK
jgi:hypothetical protein